ncbi:unnamed protein product [Malus baccata var. baccata]
MCESSCTTSLRNVFLNPLDRRTRSWTLYLTTFWKLYKSVFLSFLTQRPFISSSFWSPPCFPHLLSHYLKPEPNPPMQESNRRSPIPTKWCISRLTRMNRSGYNNSETNMRSNGKKNSGGEAEAYGYKRKSIAVYHVHMIREGAIPSEELHLQKSSWVVNCDWKCLIHVVAFEFRSNARAFLLKCGMYRKCGVYVQNIRCILRMWGVRVLWKNM